MAGIKFTSFSGLRPRPTDMRLAVGDAVVAENVDLRRGAIAPVVRQLAFDDTVDPSAVAASDAESLYVFRRPGEAVEEFWIAKAGDVDFAPSPTINDQLRQYYTDGVAPKMFTSDSVDDVTPPYGGSPDATYPNSWYYLGVPAPADAPALDLSDITVAPVVTTGVITKVTAPSLILQHVNTTVPGSGNDAVWWDRQVSGTTFGGWSRAYLVPVDAPRQHIGTNGSSQGGWGFTTGTRFKVGTVIDANNFTIVGINNMDHVMTLDVAAGYHIVPGANAEGRLVFDSSRLWAWRWDWRLPNGVEVECAGHGLLPNDIVRVTGVPESFFWNADAEIPVSPATGETKVATRDGALDFEFTGSLTFITERNGADIDTTIAEFEAPDVATRAYVYTFVSSLGEESAPSPPTDVITLYEGDTIGLDTFSAPPTAHRDIDFIRIYRTATGSAETDFQFVGEIPIATGTFTDDVADSDLGEVLQSEEWDVPPATMRGIADMPNGMMVGFYDNVVCFSEPGYPHAWPVEYRYAVSSPIVGIGVVGQSVVVTTQGAPCIITGTHARQMSIRNVEEPSPCVDKRSLADAGGTIFYCSTQGLIAANESMFKNMTESFYTKEQWQSIVGPPDAVNRSVRGWYHDSQYILSSTYGASGGGGGGVSAVGYVPGSKDTFSVEPLAPSPLIMVNAMVDPVEYPDAVAVVSINLVTPWTSVINAPTSITIGGAVANIASATGVRGFGTGQTKAVVATVRIPEGGFTTDEIVIDWPDLPEASNEIRASANVFYNVDASSDGFGDGVVTSVGSATTGGLNVPAGGAVFANTIQYTGGDFAANLDSGNNPTPFDESWYTHHTPHVLIQDGHYYVTAYRLFPEAETENLIVLSDNGLFRPVIAFVMAPAAATGPSATYSSKLIFDFRDPDGLKITTYTDTIDAAFYDRSSGELYYMVPEADEPAGANALPVGDRPVLRWGYKHPGTDQALNYTSGQWRSGIISLPESMAISAARVVCRRLRSLDTYEAYGQVALTVNGYRLDSWTTTPTDDDDVLILSSEALITGVPGVAPWAGEHRSAPYRLSTNTVIDALSITVDVAGPVEVESVQLGESFDDVEGI